MLQDWLGWMANDFRVLHVADSVAALHSSPSSVAPIGSLPGLRCLAVLEILLHRHPMILSLPLLCFQRHCLHHFHHSVSRPVWLPHTAHLLPKAISPLVDSLAVAEVKGVTGLILVMEGLVRRRVLSPMEMAVYCLRLCVVGFLSTAVRRASYRPLLLPPPTSKGTAVAKGR